MNEKRTNDRYYNDEPQLPACVTPGVGFGLFALCLILAVCCLLASGCGTVRGLGEDLQNASDATSGYIERSTTNQPAR